ncbi:MAG: hypothetical protein H7099_10180 [Gemmatimonadaceae bacterium]|nr:hypothetical protein [Gemmatimonadaceae bacterium]
MTAFEMKNGVTTGDSPTSSALVGANSVGHSAHDFETLPEPVARIWDRLEIRDRSMIMCLEAIVRTVRIDGTAPVSEIATRFLDRASAEERARTGPDALPLSASALDEIRVDLMESILPRLARAQLISLPATGLSSPDAIIGIANPVLRLALLESGLIQLDSAAMVPVMPRTVSRKITKAESAHPPTDEWAQLWFAIQRYSWTLLAVIPARPGESGLASASALVAAGRMFNEGAVHLVDATGAAPQAVDLIIASMSGALAGGNQLVIALDCPLSNPASIPIARHAGTVLLAVPLGEAFLDETRRTIESVGKQYFIGSVALHGAKG